ncbi:MAG: NAD-dependent malic enzyme [Frankiales bacterium]|nr:NAD-dependent malic enzyme [Frankiales bacterium]
MLSARVTPASQPEPESASPVRPGPDRPRCRPRPEGPPVLPSTPERQDDADRYAAHDADPAFPLHVLGKIEVRPTVRVRDNAGLALAYTPGVGRVSQAIAEDESLSWRYTWRSNSILIVTDGTAVLGLGDIGPVAALPVMEGKSLLFKEFANIDCVPICLATTDVDEIVDTVARIAPAYGGINLEDISAPRCFEIERRLQERLDIPVFHDDQHGTAVVVTAALTNAATVTGRRLADLRVVMSGAGAAGVAIARMLLSAGVGDVQVCDRKGVIGPHRDDLTDVKAMLARTTNRAGARGSLFEAMRGADVFVGVSSGTVPAEVVETMAPGSIVFSLANPTPEVHPSVARAGGAAVIATGRSDFPNQINNVLAFPGIFRGALDSGATRITEGMKLAAAEAIAGLVAGDLDPEHVVPDPFDPRLVPAVSAAVAAAAERDGVVRRPPAEVGR